MSEIVLEDNHEMPSEKSNMRTGKYPSRQMKVGQSFLLDDSDQAVSAINSARVSTRAAGDGKKYSMRKMDDGYRIWRIK